MTYRIPKVIVGPDEEPITLDEARAHLRVDDPEESDAIETDMLLMWMAAAREYCEEFTGLSFALRTLEIALDEFPTSTDVAGLGIELPMGPVVSVLAVNWGDESDEDLAAADFVLDTYSAQHRLMPAATAWPSVTADTNKVKVRYLAGYGDSSDSAGPIPRRAKAAILLVLGHLYRNREATTAEALSTLPLGVQSLLRPLRVRLGMA